MTRKDYQLIAEALNRALHTARQERNAIHEIDDSKGVTKAIVYLTDALAQDNPRFDRAKFKRACGL